MNKDIAVTLMGWGAFLKGLTLLFVPRKRVANIYKGAGFDRYFHVWMVAVLALGAWMAALAFMA